MRHAFTQVDVFTDVAYRGNPVAVVHDADELSTEEMQSLAHWTNLSETTFLLTPTHPDADYRVRIFTPVAEMPFAGHPTLGSCHAWLGSGGIPKNDGVVVQECGVGNVTIRHRDRLAFAAPDLIRSGDVDDELVARIAGMLNIDPSDILESQWVDNGPGWVAVMLGDAEQVKALRPGYIDIDLGVVGRYPDGAPQTIEVRAFFPKDGSTVEDPVTGSLNASLAQWLIPAGHVPPSYVASQGTVLGRAGRVHIELDDTGTVWVAGDTVTCITGTVDIGAAP